MSIERGGKCSPNANGPDANSAGPSASPEKIRQAHAWNAYTGTCNCKWESPHERGAERLHAEHVERVLQGLPR